jgi:hypothetical protein
MYIFNNFYGAENVQDYKLNESVYPCCTAAGGYLVPGPIKLLGPAQTIWCMVLLFIYYSTIPSVQEVMLTLGWAYKLDPPQDVEIAHQRTIAMIDQTQQTTT